jgi:hypothetical protein
MLRLRRVNGDEEQVQNRHRDCSRCGTSPSLPCSPVRFPVLRSVYDDSGYRRSRRYLDPITVTSINLIRPVPRVADPPALAPASPTPLTDRWLHRLPVPKRSGGCYVPVRRGPPSIPRRPCWPIPAFWLNNSKLKKITSSISIGCTKARMPTVSFGPCHSRWANLDPVWVALAPGGVSVARQCPAFACLSARRPPLPSGPQGPDRPWRSQSLQGLVDPCARWVFARGQTGRTCCLPSPPMEQPPSTRVHRRWNPRPTGRSS